MRTTRFNIQKLYMVLTLVYRSIPTTVSQLKMCDFLEETFKGFEVV